MRNRNMYVCRIRFNLAGSKLGIARNSRVTPVLPLRLLFYSKRKFRLAA